MKNIEFKKDAIAELNSDTMLGINSGVMTTTTIGTTSTIAVLTEQIRQTTVTY